MPDQILEGTDLERTKFLAINLIETVIMFKIINFLSILMQFCLLFLTVFLKDIVLYLLKSFMKIQIEMCT